MTKFCLIPLNIERRNPPKNASHLEERIASIASEYRPDIICLPECTLTGYLYKEKDLTQFAESIPGPSIYKISALAKKHSIYICFSLLEKSNEGVYNTSVLIDKTGKIRLKHRKNNEQPPFVNGSAVNATQTEFGKIGILICGDIFSNEVTQKLPQDLDYLIMPMARCFDGKSPDKNRWEKEERAAYIEAVRAIQTTTLIINALEINSEEPSFGGALVIDVSGEVLAESPHGTDHILLWDTQTAIGD